jgi:hypothetical protein
LNSHKKYDWATIRQGGFLRYVFTYGFQAGLLFASLMTIVNYFAATRLELLAELGNNLTEVVLR